MGGGPGATEVSVALRAIRKGGYEEVPGHGEPKETETNSKFEELQWKEKEGRPREGDKSKMVTQPPRPQKRPRSPIFAVKRSIRDTSVMGSWSASFF